MSQGPELLLMVAIAVSCALVGVHAHDSMVRQHSRFEQRTLSVGPASPRPPLVTFQVDAEALVQWLGDLELEVAGESGGLCVSGTGARAEWSNDWLRLHLDLSLAELANP